MMKNMMTMMMMMMIMMITSTVTMTITTIMITSMTMMMMAMTLIMMMMTLMTMTMLELTLVQMGCLFFNTSRVLTWLDSARSCQLGYDGAALVEINTIQVERDVTSQEMYTIQFQQRDFIVMALKFLEAQGILSTWWTGRQSQSLYKKIF